MHRPTTMRRPQPPFRLLATLLALNASVMTAQQGEEGTYRLEAEMAREVTDEIRATTFQLSDAIRGTAPAKLGATAYDEEETIHSFEMDFGAEESARCYLWETELSVAGLLDRQSQQVKAGLGENTQWRILGFDADVADGEPVLGLRWLYQIESEERTNVGLFKMYAAAPGATTLLCFHDRLGYVESFASLFRTLVADLEVPPTEEPVPDVRDVSTITMFGMAVGFVEDTLTFDADQVQVVSESAILIPTSNSEITSSDEARVELSTLDGRLISALIAEGPALGLNTQLEIQRTQGDQWRVSGIHEGEEFEASLVGNPMSAYGTIVLLRQMMTNRQSSSVTYTQWDDNSPSEISTAKIDIVDHGPPLRATITMQDIVANTSLDADGRPTSVRMEADGVDIVIERVHAEGSLSAPARAEEGADN